MTVAPPHAGELTAPGTHWIARTFLGWCAGFILGLVLLVVMESLGVRSVQFPLALGMGLGVGALQAGAVARVPGGSRAWVITSAAGLTAPFVFADVLAGLDAPVPYSLAAYVGLGGVLTGILQWRLLRTVFDGAGSWLAVTPLGWLLGGSTVWINEQALPKTPGLLGALQYVSVVLAGGIVLGVAGAIGLRSMSSRPLHDS